MESIWFEWLEDIQAEQCRCSRGPGQCSCVHITITLVDLVLFLLFFYNFSQFILGHFFVNIFSHIFFVNKPPATLENICPLPFFSHFGQALSHHSYHQRLGPSKSQGVVIKYPSTSIDTNKMSLFVTLIPFIKTNILSWQQTLAYITYNVRKD